MYEAILSAVGAFILVFKLNYDSHNSLIFIKIVQRKHIPAVKFLIGYEKNMRFLLISKSQKFGGGK